MIRPKLIIFDADGTLRSCTRTGQVCPNKVSEWKLIPGVREKLATIEWGLPVDGKTAFGIASNQAGVHYGYLSESVAFNLLYQMTEEAFGIWPREGAIQFCIHDPNESCVCRKPGALMLFNIMSLFNVAPTETLYVGDLDSDRAAARNAGCLFILAKDFFSKEI